MKTVLVIAVLAVSPATSYARYKSTDFSNAGMLYITAGTSVLSCLLTERMEAAVQGMKQAKESRVEKDKMIRERAKTQPKKSAEHLVWFCRPASQTSIQKGRARLTLVDAVKLAERSLLDKKRTQIIK